MTTARARRVALALVHYPVLDRAGSVVTSAVTNLDVHDISRSSHTFGLSDFFIVHPVAAQRELVLRIRTHWVEGSGARRIPDRKPAMEGVRIVSSLDEAVAALLVSEQHQVFTEELHRLDRAVGAGELIHERHRLPVAAQKATG